MTQRMAGVGKWPLTESRQWLANAKRVKCGYIHSYLMSSVKLYWHSPEIRWFLSELA
jgi:hypothetical protein